MHFKNGDGYIKCKRQDKDACRRQMKYLMFTMVHSNMV